MSGYLLLLGHELRLRFRESRFGVLGPAFVALASLPAAVVYATWGDSPHYLGPATFAAEVFAVLPLLTALLAFGLGVEAAPGESDTGSWLIWSISPISNARYIFLRLFSVVLLLIPLTLLPLVVAAILASARCGDIALFNHLFWPWIQQVVPVLLLAAAAGIGLGTLGRGFVGGTLLGGILFYFLYTSPWSSRTFHLSITGLSQFLGISAAISTVQGILSLLSNGSVGQYPVPASDAPLDWRVVGEQNLADGIGLVGIAFVLLAVASHFMGRFKRDLHPWNVRPNHPLRNLSKLVNAFRLRYSPDAGLRSTERWLLAGTLLAVVLSQAWMEMRRGAYKSEADSTLQERLRPDAGTPAWVAPTRAKMSGVIGPNGRVKGTMVLEIENHGERSLSTLWLGLNTDLEVVRASADHGLVEVSPHWDWQELKIAPALTQGQSRALSFEIDGRPARSVFAVPGWMGSDGSIVGADSLAATYRRGFTYEMERSYEVPDVSAGRIALAARDLMPVPIYRTQGTSSVIEERSFGGEAIEVEPFRPLTKIEVDLEVPLGLFAADACGGIVRRADSVRRLRSNCLLSLRDFAVVGGDFEDFKASADGPVIAAFAMHTQLARLHFSSGRIERLLSARLWPGMSGFASRVVVEWPDPSLHNLDSRFSQQWLASEDYDETIALTHGKLLLIAERRLVRRAPLRIESVLARSLAEELLARRPVNPEDEFLFRRLFEELANRSLGSSLPLGSVVPRFANGPGAVLVPLQQAKLDDLPYWKFRFPALVSALENIIGKRGMEEVLDRFMNRSGVGSFAEFLTLLEEAGGIRVSQFVDDFVDAGTLPILALSGVQLERSGDGWKVTGKVVNTGSGEARCLVEAQTEQASVNSEVAASPNQPGDFVLRTSSKPIAVLLDPNHVCHRYANLTLAPFELVDFLGTP